MKKQFLATLSAIALLTCSAAMAETKTGTVSGFGGDVTVTIETNDEGIITAVTAEGAAETPALGGKAIESLNEGALAAMVGTKLADADFSAIETVSGATVTSTAVKTAGAMAVGTSGAAVADGTYTVTVPAYSVTEQMTLNVTFADGKLTGIETVTAGNTPAIFATVEGNLYDRLIAAQSLEVDAIGGATVASNAVKTAVATAIEMAGGSEADWHASVPKVNALVELSDYDVIVVGLGGAGMTAYLSAAENGATVYGIETAAKVGGNSTNTSGPMAINPPSRVAANGGEIVPTEDLIADWLDYVEGDAKEDVIRMFVENSGETLDWMEQYGFAFGESMRAFFHPANWAVWTSYAGVNGGTKDDAYANAMETAKAMNEKNDYQLELTANELLTDENGKVIGVSAEYYDGTRYNIYGKSVILATGGYIGDADLCNEYLGGTWNTEAMTQCDGDAIRMAQEAVDAALFNPDVAPVSHICHLYNIVRTDELTRNQKAALVSLVLDKSKPVVSADGTPVNDKLGMFMAFDVWQAGPTYYVIYTADEMNAIRENGFAVVNTPMFMGQGGKVEANVPVTDLDEILSVGAAYGDVFCADSLTALADQLGMANLTANVADNGGAYYAVKGASYVYSTCGALDIDVDMHVLRKDGTAVENLYAVGNESIGVLLESGKAYVTYGGAAAGWALTSGRLSGAAAAAAAQAE